MESPNPRVKVTLSLLQYTERGGGGEKFPALRGVLRGAIAVRLSKSSTRKPANE